MGLKDFFYGAVDFEEAAPKKERRQTGTVRKVPRESYGRMEEMRVYQNTGDDFIGNEAYEDGEKTVSSRVMKTNRTQARASYAKMPIRKEDRIVEESGIDLSSFYDFDVVTPRNFAELEVLIDNLKERTPIIVDLAPINVHSAQRALDFLSGAVYALGGKIKKIRENLYIAFPFVG